MLSALSYQVGHFVLDILAAFPFAVAMQGLSAMPTESNKVWRRRCVGYGLGATVGVALLVRWCALALSRVAPLFWLAMLVLAAFSLLLEDRLAQATLADLAATAEAAVQPAPPPAAS
jgi:hypothetical protein